MIIKLKKKTENELSTLYANEVLIKQESLREKLCRLTLVYNHTFDFVSEVIDLCYEIDFMKKAEVIEFTKCGLRLVVIAYITKDGYDNEVREFFVELIDHSSLAEKLGL